jgi:ankyrin repeat protein
MKENCSVSMLKVVLSAVSVLLTIEQSSSMRRLPSEKVNAMARYQGVPAIDENGNTPLHNAVWRNDIEKVIFLLKQGANANATDRTGKTPLHFAAKLKNLDIAISLLAYRAKINATDKDGNTPLHFAARFGNENMVRYFVEQHNVAVNAVGACGETPLHFAVRFGRERAARPERENIVKCLIEFGAEVDVPNKNEETPLSLAEKYGDEILVNLMRPPVPEAGR